MFDTDQLKIIKDTFLSGASDAEAQVMLEVARLKNLNPFLNQIYFVKRWNNSSNRFQWSFQVSIEGLRAIAERSGNYAGQSEPEFLYDDKQQLTCVKVRVYRKGWEHPTVGVAFMAEYAQFTKEGKLTSMWASKPHVMLWKVAEAQALRKAFPLDVGGLYAEAELPDNTVDVEFSKPAELPATTLSEGSKLLQASINEAQSIIALDSLIPKLREAQMPEPERQLLRQEFLARKTAIASVK